MPTATAASPDNEAIRELRDEVKKLNRATRFSSGAMIALTLILAVFTGILIWQGF